MLKFLIYSRKSRNAQDGHTQHTHATSEWHINNYLNHLDNTGVAYEVVESHQEDISGGGYYTKRPIFKRLVDMCKEDKSLTLLVSKADRMSRNMRTGAELMELINFTLANAPDADDMQKHLEFMIAEREYATTSKRYKETYQAKKQRCERSGEKLIWGGNSDKWRRSFTTNRENHISKRNSDKAHEDKRPVVEAVKKMIKYSGNMLNLVQIAHNLTQEGFTTPRGKEYTKASVSRLIKTYDIDYICKTR